MNIIVVSDNYPSGRAPNKGAFVYNLVQELSRYHSITVIAPSKIHELIKRKTKEGYGREQCKVYRPVYVSLGDKVIFGIKMIFWSFHFQTGAVNRCLKRLTGKPDLIYTHFISNALTAIDYSIRHKIPLVMASGESTYKSYQEKPEGFLQKLTDHTDRIICVSEGNKKSLTDLGFDAGKMSVIPNAVDYTLFRPLDKETCKKKLNIPQNKFVVGFIGHFIHRKGPNRIIEAIKSLNDKEIQLICVGSGGSLTPNDFTTEIPPLANYQLPEIFNAFDIFVLPTLSEGHCNVIEEAKACCVPIVSSLGTTVEKQIDETTGILINPTKTEEIAAAIKRLKTDDALRKSMSAALESRRGERSLKNRAHKINKILNDVFSGSYPSLS